MRIKKKKDFTQILLQIWVQIRLDLGPDLDPVLPFGGPFPKDLDLLMYKYLQLLLGDCFTAGASLPGSERVRGQHPSASDLQVPFLKMMCDKTERSGSK